MKLWVDDHRQEPDADWYRARSVIQAQAYLSAYPFDLISLDYELGPANKGTGLDLVRWMIDRKLVPESVLIHSMHAEGARSMQEELSYAGYDATLAPVLPERPGVDVLRDLDTQVDQPHSNDDTEQTPRVLSPRTHSSPPKPPPSPGPPPVKQ